MRQLANNGLDLSNHSLNFITMQRRQLSHKCMQFSQCVLESQKFGDLIASSLTAPIFFFDTVVPRAAKGNHDSLDRACLVCGIPASSAYTHCGSTAVFLRFFVCARVLDGGAEVLVSCLNRRRVSNRHALHPTRD